MYLFFDVETTGLPKDYKLPDTAIDNWPRIVQLAWALYDKSGYLVRSKSEIIGQSEPLSEKVIKIHGITNEMLPKYGTSIQEALNSFSDATSYADYLIAHNIDFDKKTTGAEFVRQKAEMPKIACICTMKSTTNFCKLPAKFGYKWPKLSELHEKLFGVKIEGAHNAMIDVFAVARCFFDLKQRKIIKE